MQRGIGRHFAEAFASLLRIIGAALFSIKSYSAPRFRWRVPLLDVVIDATMSQLRMGMFTLASCNVPSREARTSLDAPWRSRESVNRFDALVRLQYDHTVRSQS